LLYDSFTDHKKGLFVAFDLVCNSISDHIIAVCEFAYQSGSAYMLSLHSAVMPVFSL